jgi:L-amino acid N-acyltransferase YncA
MAILVRAATPHDADSIAQIHVSAWRDSVEGLIPDAELAVVTVPERSTFWRQAILNDKETNVLVAVDELSDAVVGFAACGRQRAATMSFTGEIQAIYLLKRSRRKGIGRQLIVALSQALATRSITSTCAWVARDNLPARRFFTALGGADVAKRLDERADYTLHEVAYGWRKLPTE